MRQGTGLNNHQKAEAGRNSVAAELNRRGAHQVTVGRKGRMTEILASNLDQSRTVHIQVRTRTKGSWQTSIDRGRRTVENPNETTFWVFADLADALSPQFYVVPGWWIANNIYEVHQEYLQRHGGVRPENPNAKHHSIREERIEQWKDRWDLLCIL